MKKRAFSALLALALLLGLIPAAHAAGGGHWADQAVDTLNGLYGVGTFAASDENLTHGQAAAILDKMGWQSDLPNSSDSLTRSQACEALVGVFHIPTNGQSAIEHLYSQNIINGAAGGSLDPDGPVSQAQFAVLAYRVLNAMGGGLGTTAEAMKPGTPEYFSWMYLAARKCTPFERNGDAYNISNDTWTAWVDRLDEVKPGTTYDSTYRYDSDTAVTELEAAVELVSRHTAATGSPYIFDDVKPGDYYYEGVMYLFDRGILQGYGNGSFGAADSASRSDLAVLLYRWSEPDTTLTGPELLQEARSFASGYYLFPEGETEAELTAWWTAPVQRQDAVYAVVQFYARYNSGTSLYYSANPTVLDRFSDIAQMDSGYWYPMAYAVSTGLVNGTSPTTLGPTGEVTRGMAAVLLYRVQLQLDSTKMKDYQENVEYVLPGSQGGSQA